MFCFVLASMFAAAGAAQAETRTLRIYHVHTGERMEITFKRNGVYVQDGLNKLNRILRDWRRNEPTRMDPRLFDTVWEVYKKSGSNGFINVVCGYRSGATHVRALAGVLAGLGLPPRALPAAEVAPPVPPAPCC